MFVVLDIRRRELSEMRFGGLTEGCGFCIVHIIPLFAISTITLIALSFDQRILFKQVNN